MVWREGALTWAVSLLCPRLAALPAVADPAVAGLAQAPAPAPGPQLQSAKLYGNINQYAYYFTDLLVGEPNPQRVSVIVDTGSSLCGFPCDGCEHCGRHIDPPFSIKDSESASWVQCSAAECDGTCQGGLCAYTQSYTEGSSISGVWFRDLVRLGDEPQTTPVNATLGCHVDERKLFYTQRVNGIMGMAPAVPHIHGRPTILHDLFADVQHVDTGVFAMCLSEWGGELTVGGYRAEYHVDRDAERDEEGGGGVSGHDNESGNETAAGDRLIRWVPLSHSGYYSVKLAQLTMDGVVIAGSAAMFGQSLVDSGTTFTYFPEHVFKRLTAALVAACTTVPGCAARKEPGEEADCWRLDRGATNPTHFPALTLEFEGGTQVKWPARAYLFQRGDPSLWCHAFANNGAEVDTVLGVSFMIHKDIIFDLAASKLGIAEAACPEHVKSPSGPLSALAALAAWNLRPSVARVLHGVWVLALVSVLVALAWCVYLWFCDKDRPYQPPGEEEADEEVSRSE